MQLEGASAVKVAAYIGAAFVMGIGTIGPAIGQGMVGARACDNIGKYPENAGTIRTVMLLGMSIIETAPIYALVIAILLIFVGGR